MKLALRTDILAARRLLPMAALWALLRRVGFVDSLGRDSSKLGFVLNHPSKLAIGPLVQPLIHSAAVVNSITDAANIRRKYVGSDDQTLLPGVMASPSGVRFDPHLSCNSRSS